MDVRSLRHCFGQRDGSAGSSESLQTVAVRAIEARLNLAGLVAAYGFDEGAGTTVSDASGNGNTGVIGTASWTTSGRFGDALSFNGTSSRVDIADSPSLRLTTGMTFEAWINPSVVNGAWRDVIYKGNDNYFLEATSNNGSRPVAGAIVNGSHAEAYGSSALAINTWTHLAETYDGSAVRLYINGVLASSSPATGAIATSTSPLQIGGDSIYGQYFAGLIDEVRIYDRALSASEILADMNSPVGAAAPDTQAPVVAATGPPAGATVSQSVALQASASDNVGVVGVQFLLDGVPLGAEDTSAPYAFNWNTATATKGAHTLTARARDAAGNITLSAAQAVTVVPKLIITSPSGNPTITSTTLNVTYTTSGDMSGIDHVHFVLDGGPELSDPTLDGVFQLTNLTPGPRTLTSFVLHSAPGESGSVASFSVVLSDTTSPSVTLSSPSDGSTVSGVIQLSADALDNVAVAGVQFLLDGARRALRTSAGRTRYLGTRRRLPTASTYSQPELVMRLGTRPRRRRSR